MIIQNQRQYRITKAWISRFEKELIANDTRELGPNEHPDMRQVVHDAVASEIESLRAQMDHYEKLRDGRTTGREITSLHELPTALIEARIAAKLTQRQIAERIGVAEQQIQRWEADGYSGVSIHRLQEIADALGVQIHGTITYSSTANAMSTSTPSMPTPDKQATRAA
jgi:DNA-binding XRE family transcriptional regulator